MSVCSGHLLGGGQISIPFIGTGPPGGLEPASKVQEGLTTLSRHAVGKHTLAHGGEYRGGPGTCPGTPPASVSAASACSFKTRILG